MLATSDVVEQHARISGSVTEGFSLRTILNADASFDSERFESRKVKSVSTDADFYSVDND